MVVRITKRDETSRGGFDPSGSMRIETEEMLVIKGQVKIKYVVQDQGTHSKGDADTRQRVVAAQFSRSPIGLPVCPEREKQDRKNGWNRSPVREHHRGSKHSANKPMNGR